MWTSPGIVVTRFDASTGTSLVLEGGRLVEQPSFSGEEQIVFPEPYGAQAVHLVPHPEPVTLPRYLDVADVVFKVGYPADETRRIEVLLELGFDRDEPFELDGVSISPRRFAAAYIGRRGIGPSDRSANVKQVRSRARATAGRSASSTTSRSRRSGDPRHRPSPGPSRRSPPTSCRAADRSGVHPPEGAFDPPAFLAALAERGFTDRSSARSGVGEASRRL